MNFHFYKSSSALNSSCWSSVILNVHKCYLLSRLVWIKWPKDTCLLMWWPLLVRKQLFFKNQVSEEKKNLLCESGKDAKYKLLYEVY